MSDLVNSSDEAVEAAIKAASAANDAFCEDHDRGAMWDGQTYHDSYKAEVLAVWPVIAAAVRAEAVAAERRRIHVPEIAALSTCGFGVFCAACSAEANDYIYPCAFGGWSDIPPFVVAAGSR